MELILLLLSFLLLSSTTSNAGDPVIDSEGNVLQRGQQYYAQSTFKDPSGGGLKLEYPKTKTLPCPLFVTMGPSSNAEGEPLSFHPENENDDTVLEGSTLNIKFEESTRCRESTMWQYVPTTNYVRTGGNSSKSPGPDFSRFAITKDGGLHFEYYIRVCPCSVGAGWPSCGKQCLEQLGVVGGEVQGALGMNSSKPHAVIFVKAGNGGVASSVLRSKA